MARQVSGLVGTEVAVGMAGDWAGAPGLRGDSRVPVITMGPPGVCYVITRSLGQGQGYWGSEGQWTEYQQLLCGHLWVIVSIRS